MFMYAFFIEVIWYFQNLSLVYIYADWNANISCGYNEEYAN